MRFRLLVTGLLAFLLFGCSSDDSDAKEGSADRAAFATELMHRDAALLNLLDASLGQTLPTTTSTAVETVRADATARIETSADLLAEWGADVPVTVRDHGVDHGIEADAPDLEGTPTEDDIHGLEELSGDDFATAFTELLRAALDGTTTAASAYDGTDQSAGELAEAAERQSQAALDTLD
ncbi:MULTISPECIES: DUF305 domain-containing protein [unclassified Nocardioides]|uniref:DUF305 domain-containing protein n=1 Tax=unclassified Nocardioides TaxID=2615069 RepID=UPI0006FD081B|nr:MULTISPECIES: DUF305 domain-containing protein [unclassified Nocardioides]KQY55402.1 hypothetical protein ASD30_15955 [Nocardioides sp. Root140]KRF14565.1 hypothetical protein ASH02_09590 [Nocardioides sp. Soil796]